MEFRINTSQWKIEPVDSDWLLTEYKKENDKGMYCFGLTRYTEQVIYINNAL